MSRVSHVRRVYATNSRLTEERHCVAPYHQTKQVTIVVLTPPIVVALGPAPVTWIGRIGEAGGCQELCKTLRTCAEFGNACSKVQHWALGALANLMACTQNRRIVIDGEAMASWIHTVMANSSCVMEDRCADSKDAAPAADKPNPPATEAFQEFGAGFEEQA